MRKSMFLVVALVATLFSPVFSPGTTAHAAVPKPPTPTGLPRSIEPLARYVPQESCDPVTRWGTSNLQRLLSRTYPGTWFGSIYPCGSNGSVSEHYEGRSLDWGVSVRNATQYAYARTVIGWLMATDRYGHKYAIARRLGIQYLIYNGKIWGSWGGWEQYNGCATKTSRGYDNYCHRDHMHFSLSWNGANGAVSFWTKKLYPFDYGPCRTRDLNWAKSRTGWNFHSCTWYRDVQPPAGSSTLKQRLVKYSGAYLKYGRTGPIVTAIQQALHVSATGQYNSATVAAVVRFQRRHGIGPSGTMNLTTWRHLLPAVH